MLTRRPCLSPDFVQALRTPPVLLLLLAAAVPGNLGAQVAGQNINMVSGTKWPGGDPFLQRQNEPSLAVSSRNQLHLLAGANDYRTVDLPTEPGSVPGTLSGDAWLGVFKSFDGGLSWQSTLLPGCPQDQSAIGKASPLKAYAAAADPTVRAGANGLLYYSGMAFNRGTNIGAVFLARYFDSNNKENGDATDPSQGKDPIAYLDARLIDTGTSGQFLDKPWLAVDVPRSGSGATTCSVTLPGGTTQSFVGGNVYMTWSRFTGSSSTKIMFTRSLDCGKTWSTPIKISESNSINQGTNIAVDPVNGTVYVAWRRFATSSQPDAVMVAKSNDFGQTFTSKNTVQVTTITPFDQGTSGTRFRTNALPSIAVSADANNTSRVHIAWAQRNGANQDAQIVVASSTDGLNWSAPASIDAGALRDDSGATFGRGHQFMPQLTFSQGRLMVLYYDQRLDHTLGLFTPYQPFLPDASGSFYKVFRDLRIEPAGSAPVFGLTIDDLGLALRRHTIDLRVAEAIPGGTLSFHSSSVSQYKVGLRANLSDEEGNPLPLPITSLNQLQSNAPNLPLFAQGTVPFLGDYIDIAGPSIVPNGTGGWKFNTAPTSAPVFYATWTDNRDVVAPKDGNWANYTPVGGGGTSVLDPTKTTPACATGQEGMRNQNVYSSRITEGLLVGSPQNIKPLFAAPKARAFIVTLQNLTSLDRTFTLSLAPGAGVTASFLQTAAAGILTVTVPARSGAARPVFASSSNPAGSVAVNVTESGICTGACLSGSLVLNPEGSVSPLAQPDGTTTDIGMIEIYTPTMSVWNPVNANPFLSVTDPNQNISNQNISNQNISNADPAIQNISNQNISNQNISNQNISNPDPAVQNISNQNISNQNISNQNISNQNISNQNISNTSITDATYAVTNSGNTTHSYRVALYGNNPKGTPLQLIVTKNYSTPTSMGCTLQNMPQTTVLANVNNAPIAPTLAAATDPNISDGSTTNATMALAPGETAFVTLRGALSKDDMAALTRSLTPVVTAHGANTNGSTNDFTMLLFIQTTGGTTLPAAVVGTSYTWTFQVQGGKAPFTWSLAPGSTLPNGLTLSSSGTLSGTPTVGGSFTFTVKVTDSTTGTPQSATQTFNLTVTGATTTVALSSSPASPTFGQPLLLTANVTYPSGSGIPAPAGNVAFSDGGTTLGTVPLTGGSASYSTSALATGSHSFSAAYSGDTNFTGSTFGPVVLTVQKAASTTILSSSANPSKFGQSVTLTATVSGPGATPTGTVTFLDGVTSIGTGVLNAGVATFSTSSLAVAAPHSVTASYGGDGNFNSSTSSAVSQVVQKADSSTVETSAPNPSTFGQSVTFSATVSSPAGTPTGAVTFSEGANSLGTGTVGAGGVATFSTSSLSVTTHIITASYGGDTSFNGSTSAVSQVVNKATSTTALAASPNPSTFGASVTLTATVTGPGGVPTGTVTFKDGVTVLGTASLTGGTATFSTSALSVATHAVTAIYGGDGSFNGSASASVSQVVNQAATATALTSAPNPSSFGASVTFTATVTGPGATPTGSVTFKEGSTVLGSSSLSGGTASFSTSSLSVATHSITASYGGDTSFNGSTSVASQVVNKAASVTAVAATPNPSTFGQTVTVTATVAGPGATPTGPVNFFDGATLLGSGNLNASGVATISTAALSAGSHSIAASYAGDPSFSASTSGVLPQTVNKAPTSTVLVTTPNPSVLGQAVTLTAAMTTTASGVPGPTGSVAFFDGGTMIGTAPLTGSLATLSTAALSIGSHTILATYSADANYSSSSSSGVTQVVNVPPFTFIGFGSPLATAGSLAAPTSSGIANYGNGVPVKYQLLDYLGNNVTDLATTTLIQAVANSSCSAGHAPDGAVTVLYSPTTGAKGGSTFRSGSTGFIFNWDSGVVPGPGCYTVVVQLNDGSSARATNIQLQ